jgi:hypothetical protein
MLKMSIVALLDTSSHPPRPVAVSNTPDLVVTGSDRLLEEAEARVGAAMSPLDREDLRALLALLRMATGRYAEVPS